jgi:hypothetical protein
MSEHYKKMPRRGALHINMDEHDLECVLFQSHHQGMASQGKPLFRRHVKLKALGLD